MNTQQYDIYKKVKKQRINVLKTFGSSLAFQELMNFVKKFVTSSAMN